MISVLKKAICLTYRRNKNCKSKPTLPKVRPLQKQSSEVSQPVSADRHGLIYDVFLCLQHLLDVKSLRYLSSVLLHDRITKSLLHLHKKKKPPSISAQFQVSAASALCWRISELQQH